MKHVIGLKEHFQNVKSILFVSSPLLIRRRPLKLMFSRLFFLKEILEVEFEDDRILQIIGDRDKEQEKKNYK